MVLTKLYREGRRLTHSNLCWNDGIAEIGGVDKVQPLWYVTEEKQNPRLINGNQISGRVREGIVVVSADYLMNPTAFRAVVRNGLPLGNPEEAVKANQAGRQYALGSDKDSIHQVIEAVRNGNAFRIDESRVQSNFLEMKLKDFVSPLTLFLFGGDDDKREDRTREAGEYFEEQFKKAGKSNDSIRLYLPELGVAQKGEVVGTQIWSGGLGGEFGLCGDSRYLDNAKGVFGVSG